MEISEIIKKLRADTGRNQSQMGISQVSLCAIETSKRSPKVSTLLKIAAITGTELEIKFNPISQTISQTISQPISQTT